MFRLFKKKSKTQQLLKQSEGILGFFVQTQEKCKQLKDQIGDNVAAKKAEINNLNSKVQILEDTSKKHENLHKKIDELLNS